MPSITYINSTASATCASTQPLSIMPAANGKVYAVNGVQRGFFYNGTTVFPIGITAAGTVSASATASPLYYYVSSVEVTDGGQNYYQSPSVTIGGVSGAKAELAGSEVGRVTFLTSATTYTSPPSVLFSGGQASGAAASAIMEATVTGVQIGYGYGLYASPPDVNFYPRSGVTEVRPARGYGVLNIVAGATTGYLSGIVVTDAGEYQYTSGLTNRTRPVGATVAAPIAGFSPSLDVRTDAVVDAVTVSGGGSNYASPPAVRFTTYGVKRRGGGAGGVASVASGGVTAVTVTSFGSGYDGRVAVSFVNESAKASAIMAPRLAGKYLCGVRYVDASGQPGNPCQLFTVDCGDGASSIIWDLSNLTYADSTPNRVAAAELWRTSGDQAITLYRVATVSIGTTAYADSMPDADLSNTERAGYGELPILTADGYVNAFRYGVPPASMSAVCMFEDRAWYAVDESGAEPNAIYFSESGEPESVSSTNQIIVQSSGRDSDRITGLFPFEGALYACQQRCITRITVAGNPLESAAAVQVAQRGLLNDRCWALHEGVAYIADSTGLYAFDGAAVKPLSDPIKDYWTAPLMNFSLSKWFFVAADPDQQVVRLYYIHTGSGLQRPTRALCYSLVTQAWWEERYADQIRCVATAYQNGRPVVCGGGSSDIYTLHTGTTDNGDGIPYSLKTGNYPLNNDPKRGMRIVYTPTSASHSINAALYHSGSLTPQSFAVDTNPGAGFVTTAGSSQATLDMHASKNASGFAQLSLSGRLDDRSASANRHIAIGLSGEQGSLAKPVIHSVQIEGAG